MSRPTKITKVTHYDDGSERLKITFGETIGKDEELCIYIESDVHFLRADEARELAALLLEGAKHIEPSTDNT